MDTAETPLMPFNISYYEDRKSKKCKLERCKQQSNNHISSRTAFVELALKHKHFLTLRGTDQFDCHTNIGSAPRIHPQMNSSLYTSKQNRSNPNQLFCRVRTHRCVMRKRGFTEESRTGTGRHASVWWGVRRPSPPPALCLLGDEVRRAGITRHWTWGRDHTHVTLTTGTQRLSTGSRGEKNHRIQWTVSSFEVDKELLCGWNDISS